MIHRIRTSIVCSILLVLMFLGASPASAQPPEAQQKLLLADGMISDSRYDEALELLESLSRDYPGTLLDAKARMSRAYILGAVRKDNAAARQLYDSVLAEFPNTIGLWAEADLADAELFRQPHNSSSPSFQQYLQRMDGIIRRAGGPSIFSAELRVADITPVAEWSPQEQRVVLYDLYGVIAGRMFDAALHTPDNDTRKRSVRIHVYRYQLLPEAFDYLAIDALRGDIMEVFDKSLEQQNADRDNDTTPPDLTIVSPPEGSQTSERRPEIAFTLSDGDAGQSQTAWDQTRVSLDGTRLLWPVEPIGSIESLPPGTQWDMVADLDNPAGPALTVSMALIPQADLAPGPHTVQVTVFDRNRNETTRTWSFTVCDVATTPLNLTVDVLSKHVKPRKGEVARLRATASHSPATFEFQVYRVRAGHPQQSPDLPVYSQAGVTSQNGVQDLQWDGRDLAGTPVANGDYDMVVTAVDCAGQRATSTVGVQVNNTGSGAWLVPWRLARCVYTPMQPALSLLLDTATMQPDRRPLALLSHLQGVRTDN
ncbi:MAG: hypothetical protein AB1758_10955 [Candidatus Eremiobacterota bacterium]